MSTPDPRTAKPEDFPNTVLSAPPGGPGALALPPLVQPGPRQADSPALATAVALWNVLAMDRDKSWIAVGVALTQHPEMATWIVQARLSLP